MSTLLLFMGGWERMEEGVGLMKDDREGGGVVVMGEGVVDE